MKITKFNPCTGKTNTLEVPCTQEQLDAWRCGTLIQNAMPNVPHELREFLISGFTPGEWEGMFGHGEGWDDDLDVEWDS